MTRTLGLVAFVSLLLAASIWIRIYGCQESCEALDASYVKTTIAACICERDGKRFVGGHP
ncbi:MAG TPA: hypothetical protein VLI71_00230 [Gammaproteobacteria bacterium]|nr:hypothetical protein [Gammaproteobacteria bacterium]